MGVSDPFAPPIQPPLQQTSQPPSHIPVHRSKRVRFALLVVFIPASQTPVHVFHHLAQASSIQSRGLFSDAVSHLLKALLARPFHAPPEVRHGLFVRSRDPVIPSPTLGATTGVRPAAGELMPAPTGFATRSMARPSTPTVSSSPQPASGQVCVTDWSFSFRCSPPRLAATQLPFDSARLFTAWERTSTAPSSCLLRRTSAE